MKGPCQKNKNRLGATRPSTSATPPRQQHGCCHHPFSEWHDAALFKYSVGTSEPSLRASQCDRALQLLFRMPTANILFFYTGIAMRVLIAKKGRAFMPLRVKSIQMPFIQ